MLPTTVALGGNADAQLSGRFHCLPARRSRARLGVGVSPLREFDFYRDVEWRCATHHCRCHQTAGGSGSRGGEQAPKRALETDDGVNAKRRQRGAAARCTTAGCSLLAGPRNGAGVTSDGKCCDFCPTSHTWACLSRHTADERAAVLRHQAAHDSAGGEQSTSSTNAKPAHEPSAVATVTDVYEIEAAVPQV